MRLLACCSTLALLAACGSDETFTDAAPGDDAPEIDANVGIDAAPEGTVHVTTFARNGTVADERFANVEVLVVGLDGTLRDRDQTDTNGEATLDVTAGDTVTAIYDLVTYQQVYLTTIAGVQPGDELTFGGLSYPPLATSLGTMNVTWPAFTATPTTLSLYTSCGSMNVSTAATSQAVTVSDDCVGAGVSAIVVGYDASGNITQWGQILDAPFVASGTAAITTLDAPSTFDVALTGMSPEVSYFEADVFSSIGNYQYITHSPWYTYGNPQGGAFSGSLSWAGGGKGPIVETYFQRNGNYGQQETTQRLPAGATTLTAPDAPLPWLSDTVLTLIPERLIQWFQIGTAPYDLGLVTMRWSANTTSTATDSGAGFGSGSGSSTYFYWSIVLPPGVTALAFPELPEDLAAYGPSDDEYVNTQVELFDTTVLDGYDAVRAMPEWGLTCLMCARKDAVTYPYVRGSYTGSGAGLAAKRHHRPARVQGAGTRR